MRLPGLRAPQTNFTIPPLAPTAVVEAYSTYDRVCEQLAEAQGELADAREAIQVSAKEALAADAAAIVAGGKVKDARVIRQEQETAALALEQKIRTLERAADLAGNDLADAIGGAKDEWAASLDQAKAEAVEEYRAKLGEMQDAATNLGSARRAAEWLGTFDVGRARIGEKEPFSHGTLWTKAESGALRGEHAVRDVLALCEKAADDPVERQLTSRVAK